jgi:uncharacterized protein (DUF2141 family)
VCLFAVVSMMAQSSPTTTCRTLTIVVEGMNSNVGNLGALVFNNEKGWPEDRTLAPKDISAPAEKGRQTLTIPGLAPGKYAVALIHDVNQTTSWKRIGSGSQKNNGACPTSRMRRSKHRRSAKRWLN